MAEAQQAFEELGRFLTNPPVLVPPTPEEPLLLYIAATSHVVSTALVVERKEEGHIQQVQRPVYFVSEVLATPKPATLKYRRCSMRYSLPHAS